MHRAPTPHCQGEVASPGSLTLRDRASPGPRTGSPMGLDSFQSTTPAAGVSYRSPGMGRTPGTRPAFVDQLRANAVATWKAAEDS